MLNIVIVDDEINARLRLRQLLQDCESTHANQIVFEADNALTALAWLKQHALQRVDILFVDVQMPQMNGFEFVDALQQFTQDMSQNMPFVVFITAFDEYALQAFDVNAVDYLLKPVKIARLQQSLTRIVKKNAALDLAQMTVGQDVKLQQASKKRDFFAIQERGSVLFVPVKDVLYFRSDMKYVTIKTIEKSYLIDDSLNALAEEFPDLFLRIHRSFLMAKSAIGVIHRNKNEGLSDANYLIEVIGTNEKLPVSRRQWTELRKLLNIKR